MTGFKRDLIVLETKMKEEEEEHFNRIKACPEKSVTFQDDEKVKKAQISDSTKIISLKENQNMKNSDSGNLYCA